MASRDAPAAVTSGRSALPLAEYPSLLRPVAVADPLWQRLARWLLYGMVYLLLTVVALVLVVLAADGGGGVSGAILAVALVVASGGVIAALLALCVRLRPRPVAEPATPADAVFVLYAWGAPRALTVPVTVAGYGAASALAFAGIDWVSQHAVGVSAWLLVPVYAIWMLVVLVGLAMASDRVVLRLRRRLQRRYPHHPLLVAGPDGIAAPGWGPLAWEAVRDVRLQWFTAGKNRILLLAVDTVVPPGPDDLRAGWAHRHLHGDAFTVDLRKAVMSEHEALAAVRAQRPDAGAS